jgi:enoyl-CoA hydratase/carnithine racemase
MTDKFSCDEIAVSIQDHVAMVEIQRPPHNFFDVELISRLATTFETLDEEPQCRAIVLASEGKSFSAGANFSDGSGQDIIANANERHLYDEALRLFNTRKPIVGAIQGAAIGGGLGLALVPDFRVGCLESRFSANFTLLGFHPGFGLTHTLPALMGQQNANLMMYTGRRIKGEEALGMGLLDVLVPADRLRAAAFELADEIGSAAPLGVMETRASLRIGLVDKIRAATEREKIIQNRLRDTHDFREGIEASAQRRKPEFKGE